MINEDLGDKALERVISECTNALAFSGDARLAQAQRYLVGLRSASQIERMERAQRLISPRVNYLRGWNR